METHLERAPKVLGTMLDYLGLDASVKSEKRDNKRVYHLSVSRTGQSARIGFR